MNHRMTMLETACGFLFCLLVCAACQSQRIDLPSSDSDYWHRFKTINRVWNEWPKDVDPSPFYETIADSEDVLTKCLGIRAILEVDGAKAMPVFRRMVRDKRFSDEVRALEIYGSTGASFLANELPCASEYEEFLKWALTHEKGARSRSKLDTILQKSDPTWHGSRERLRYLKKTLAFANTEPQREFIRRKIQANDEPLPVPVPPSRSQPKIIITP